MTTRWAYLDSDLVRVREAAPNAKGGHTLVATLFWGDRVKLVGSSADGPLVDLPVRREENPPCAGFTMRDTPSTDTRWCSSSATGTSASSWAPT